MAGPSLSAQPRRVVFGTSVAPAPAYTVGGTYLIGIVLGPVLIGTQSSNAPFYLTPADWAVYDKQLLFQLTLAVGVADVNPAISMFGSLYPVTGITGTGGGSAICSVGPEVPGSRTPTWTTAAATLSPRLVSGGFTVPTEGWYSAAVTFNSGFAANSKIQILWGIDALTR